MCVGETILFVVGTLFMIGLVMWGVYTNTAPGRFVREHVYADQYRMRYDMGRR